MEGIVDPIAVIAGIVQTALYVDFFYVYFTKCVPSFSYYFAHSLTKFFSLSCLYAFSEYCKGRSLSCRRKVAVHSCLNSGLLLLHDALLFVDRPWLQLLYFAH